MILLLALGSGINEGRGEKKIALVFPILSLFTTSQARIAASPRERALEEKEIRDLSKKV